MKALTSEEKIIQAKLKELRVLVEEREQIQARITKTEAAIRAFIDLLEDENEQAIYTMRLQDESKPRGLTETIKRVLRLAKKLTPQEVREGLSEAGFPLGNYVNPLAVIYTTLNRLAEQGLVIKDGSGGFEWVEPPVAKGRYAHVARPSDVPAIPHTKLGESE
jgi:hypothetical protein